MTEALATWPSLRTVLLAGVATTGLLLATPGAAQEQPLADAEPGAAAPAITARELQAAIDAIKRRVADQQEARETSGAGELAAELRSARAAITELTQNLMLLRSERDALQADLEARRATETALRAELATRLDNEKLLEAALGDATARVDQAEERARLAETSLAEAAERAAAERAERDALVAEAGASLDAEQQERRTLQTRLSALEGRLEQLAGELAIAEEAATSRVRELETERAGREAAETAQAEADSALQQVTARLAAAEVERSELEAALAAAAEDAARATEALAVAEAGRAALTERLDKADAALAQATDRLAAELATAESERAALAASLAEADDARAALAARDAEFAGLREVASRSVAEVEALGETLLATLAENEALTTALAEVRATRAALEDELGAMRRDLASYAAGGGRSGDDADDMPIALVASDAVVEALDAEMADLRRQITALTEELIARDKQLAEDSDLGDVDALTQRLGLLQREVETLTAENRAMAGELATLQARADLVAPELITASLAPDEAVEHFLGQLNAVDTGDGWWMTVPDGLVFAPGSNELAPGTEAVVAQIAALIGFFGEAPVRIVGHTDSFGDAAVNKQLSLERARTVAGRLVDEFGVDAERISTEGFGEEQPIASNATIDGRRTNRRVEVYIQR